MTDKNKNYLVVEFQDGLPIIPRTWLTSDLKRAKWPNCYVTSNRYDRAVKCMEEPQSTWEEYPVVKIFATCCNVYFLFFSFIFHSIYIYFYFVYC